MDACLWGCAPCSAPGRALHNFCFLCESHAGASGTHPRASPHPWEVTHPSLALSSSPSALGMTNYLNCLCGLFVHPPPSSMRTRDLSCLLLHSWCLTQNTCSSADRPTARQLLHLPIIWLRVCIHIISFKLRTILLLSRGSCIL